MMPFIVIAVLLAIIVAFSLWSMSRDRREMRSIEKLMQGGRDPGLRARAASPGPRVQEMTSRKDALTATRNRRRFTSASPVGGAFEPASTDYGTMTPGDVSMMLSSGEDEVTRPHVAHTSDPSGLAECPPPTSHEAVHAPAACHSSDYSSIDVQHSHSSSFDSGHSHSFDSGGGGFDGGHGH